MRRRNVLAALVIALGCSQMLAYLTGAKTVGVCGATSCVAPMAEVFSELDAGDLAFEPFAERLTLRGLDESGANFERVLTPELFARIEGPHARRAAYEAAFSQAPLLVNASWQEAWCHGFGEQGPLRSAFDLPAGAHALALTVQTLTKEHETSWVLSASCTR